MAFNLTTLITDNHDDKDIVGAINKEFEAEWKARGYNSDSETASTDAIRVLRDVLYHINETHNISLRQVMRDQGLGGQLLVVEDAISDEQAIEAITRHA